MVNEITTTRYMQSLLTGDRKSSKSIIEEVLQHGIPANRVYMDVIWPVMVEIDNLFRGEKINTAQEHLATRINRAIVDQLQNKLPKRAPRDRRIVIVSGPNEGSELGAQMAADLFESDGWEVRFLGAGVSNDDILSFINEYSPNILMIYGSTGKCAPSIRALIDTVRDVNAWPNMKIMLSGGVFNRADGLWEEIGADLYAESAAQAVEVADATGLEGQAAEDKPVPAKRKRNIKRKKAELVTA